MRSSRSSGSRRHRGSGSGNAGASGLGNNSSGGKYTLYTAGNPEAVVAIAWDLHSWRSQWWPSSRSNDGSCSNTNQASPPWQWSASN